MISATIVCPKSRTRDGKLDSDSTPKSIFRKWPLPSEIDQE